MTVVDRHLAGEFLRLFVLALITFLGLFLVIEFFEKLRMILRYQATLGDSLLYFTSRVPWMVSQVLPMAALLATVLSLTLLSRNGEITALRCGGVPLRRLVLPYLVCGLVLALCNGFIQEVAAPRGFAFAREVQEVRIKGRSPRSLLKTEDLWLRSGNNVVHVGRVEPEGTVLVDVTVAELDGSRVVRRTDARQARWNGERWLLVDAEIRHFDADGIPRTERLAESPCTLEERPEEFRVPVVTAVEESWAELKRRLERYRKQGLDTRDLEVGLWAKTSVPFAAFLMPLLAFPFGVRAGGRGGASAGIVLAILLGFSYWLVLAVGLSLGKAGVLPPVLAAWVGNIGFAVLGVVLLARAERHG
ncbi:MAG: LPS export ABC transporter permease LptG [Deferrisomatales bacterium]|nr:LPS export ABC transporter permease LptG [Deferrisomatales bacterium]